MTWTNLFILRWLSLVTWSAQLKTLKCVGPCPGCPDDAVPPSVVYYGAMNENFIIAKRRRVSHYSKIVIRIMEQWVVCQYGAENRDNTHIHNLTQADVAGGAQPITARSLSCITASFSECLNALFTLFYLFCRHSNQSRSLPARLLNYRGHWAILLISIPIVTVI
jgi:hypothetical protein